MTVFPVSASTVAPTIPRPRFMSNAILTLSAVISGSETFPRTFKVAYLRAMGRIRSRTSSSSNVSGSLLSSSVAAREAASDALFRMSRCPTRWLWSMISAAPPIVMIVTATAAMLVAPPRVSRRKRPAVPLIFCNMFRLVTLFVAGRIRPVTPHPTVEGANAASSHERGMSSRESGGVNLRLGGATLCLSEAQPPDRDDSGLRVAVKKASAPTASTRSRTLVPSTPAERLGGVGRAVARSVVITLRPSGRRCPGFLRGLIGPHQPGGDDHDQFKLFGSARSVPEQCAQPRHILQKRHAGFPCVR